MNPLRCQWPRPGSTKPGNSRKPTPGVSNCFACIAALVLSFALGLPLAQAADNDGGMWLTANLSRPLRDDLVAGLIIEPRFDQDAGRLERMLLRPSITRNFARTALTFGYDAHLIQAPRDRLEQRLWQQLQFTPGDSPWRALLRLRVEERFIEDIGGMVLTTRWKAQVRPQVPGSDWYLRLANEVFFNLNGQARGPLAGYDQNRAQAAFGRRLGTAGIELGYQAQHLRLRGRNRLIHQFLASISLRF